MSEDHLLGEEHASDRRVERGGDRTRRTRGDQRAPHGIGKTEVVADVSGNAGAEMHDRPFAARARANAERQRARDRAEQALAEG